MIALLLTPLPIISITKNPKSCSWIDLNLRDFKIFLIGGSVKWKSNYSDGIKPSRLIELGINS